MAGEDERILDASIGIESYAIAGRTAIGHWNYLCEIGAGMGIQTRFFFQLGNEGTWSTTATDTT